MPIRRSPEIEAVVRRALQAYNDGSDALVNLMSADTAFRVIGFDQDEFWTSRDEFIEVRRTQTTEAPVTSVEPHNVEAFEDGTIGWAVFHSTFRSPQASTALRHSAVLRLEDGVWRIVHWHNSVPTSNEAVYGVELTVTLDELVRSVLDAPAPASPTHEGTMTLVFTDIVDSTAFAESVGDAVWAETVATHEATIRRVTEAEGGTVVKFLGDGSMLAFESTRAALRASVAIQQSTADTPISVRIGIHTGEVTRTVTDLFGLTVNKAARVAAAAGTGEIMVSSTTCELIGRVGDVEFGESRQVALKGISGNHYVLPVLWE